MLARRQHAKRHFAEIQLVDEIEYVVREVPFRQPLSRIHRPWIVCSVRRSPDVNARDGAAGWVPRAVATTAQSSSAGRLSVGQARVSLVDASCSSSEPEPSPAAPARVVAISPTYGVDPAVLWPTTS
jgi:hypothetical protein